MQLVVHDELIKLGDFISMECVRDLKDFVVMDIKRFHKMLKVHVWYLRIKFKTFLTAYTNLHTTIFIHLSNKKSRNFNRDADYI